MPDAQDEMRELLRQRAGDIGLDPRIPARVVRRSRRRRALTVGAAVLGAAAFALVVVAGLRSLSIPDGKTPAPQPPPVREEMPTSFVGLMRGELVLASTATGEVQRVIADRSVVGSDDPTGDPEPPVRPVMTPDPPAVYFSTFRRGIDGPRVVRVLLEGGEPEDLGRGADPAVSLDGDRLAYRACAREGCGQALVLVNLRTGDEVRVEPGDAYLQVGESVWLPDGRLLVALLPPMDGSPYRFRVVDPARPPADLLGAPSVPDPAPDTIRWGPYGYDAQTGGVIVGQEGPDDLPLRFVSVDPDTGEVLATVVSGSWWQVHPHGSGRDLLLLDFQDRVYISRDGAEPRLVAEGFTDVAW